MCEKHSKHTEALEELKKGTAFNVVAEKYSEDKARNGGSLGYAPVYRGDEWLRLTHVVVYRWMQRTGMIGAFQDNAFDIPVSTCAQPNYKVIKSSHGYQYVPSFESLVRLSVSTWPFRTTRHGKLLAVTTLADTIPQRSRVLPPLAC